ncbi:hypothetical protein RB195_003199 [Necator americanus]|uniref:Uncharacterized protein n=1 Tax=Necator americanus TaxID=51031 RepID=A0ABR1DNT0_NECAM
MNVIVDDYHGYGRHTLFTAYFKQKTPKQYLKFLFAMQLANDHDDDDDDTVMLVFVLISRDGDGVLDDSSINWELTTATTD